MILVRGPGVGPDDSRTPLGNRLACRKLDCHRGGKIERGLRTRLAWRIGWALLVDPAGDADDHLPYGSSQTHGQII